MCFAEGEGGGVAHSAVGDDAEGMIKRHLGFQERAITDDYSQ